MVTTRPRWNRWQRRALQWSFVPLVGGAILVGAFFATKSILIGWLGLLWIWFGVAVSIAVFVAIGLGWRVASREGIPTRARARPALSAFLVMIANYPAALGALWLGSWWWGRSTLEFVNGGATPWGPLRVVGAGVDVGVDALEVGASTVVTVSWLHDGNPEVRDAGSATSNVDLGYATSDWPIDARIVRQVDGTVAVRVVER